jgi:Bacterial aa3 type cytochrome c oxidase subunit IV
VTDGLLPLLSPADCANCQDNRQDNCRKSLERPMSDHNEVAYTTADGNDYQAHEQTYEGFIMLVKYGSAAVIFIVAMMAIFLT